MIFALCAAVIICCAAAIVACVKLRSLQNASNDKTGWYYEPAARKWSKIGSTGYIMTFLLCIPLFIIDQKGLSAAAGIAGTILIFILPATGDGEGAN